MNIDYLTMLEIPLKIGGVLAMIISWNQHKSILMALVHSFFSWFYIIYFYLGKDETSDRN